MTFQIQHDGKTWTVHTEVGDGPTQVMFDEDTEERPETDKVSRRPHQEEMGEFI